MRDIAHNVVPLQVLEPDEYASGPPVYGDIDLAGQARRLVLAINVGAMDGTLSIEVVQTDTAPGDSEEVLLIDEIDGSGLFGVDFTPTKRYVTLYVTVGGTSVVFAVTGMAYLLRDIPEGQSAVQMVTT